MRVCASVFGLSMVVSMAGAAGAPPVQPTYPEGSATPRDMTPAEAAWVKENPIVAAPRGGAVPTGDVHCVAEYEPMEGILLAYEGSSSWLLILRQMAAQITTVGNANVYVMCDTSSEASSTYTAMVNAGANPARVFTFVKTTDTIWIRDYGPRYIYENGIRS
ncbi:MAG: hypothetical protein R3B57_09125, partial [Phycisphaerales bacterium]